MPTHTMLCSFVLLAVLTPVLVSFGSDVVWAAADASAAVAPAMAAVDPDSPLTSEVMSKMLQLIALRGTDRDLPALYANALGLSAEGQTWPDRQSAANEDPDNILHAFAVGRGGDRDIVISVLRENSLHAFRAHRDGKVVTALISDKQTGKITMRAPAEAQKELDVELAFWASGVEKLIAGH